MGCSGSVTPTSTPLSAPQTVKEASSGSEVLWGYWHCTFNPETNQIDVTQLRTAMFTANVNNLLEAKPNNLLIGDLNLADYFTEGRIDCTVTLKHPFPGLHQYDGFDVLGVFMHNGETSIQYDSLRYSGGPGAGANEATLLNADGYTRWYNQPEFDGTGSPLFEFSPGKLANLPTPTATLNPYKIFADDLGINDDYYQWITASGNADNRGVFRAGAANSRRYMLQFPMVGGVPVLDFQYAVIATWEPGDTTLTGDPAAYDPGDFPSSANIEEPFFVNVTTAGSDLFNDGAGQSGGTFKCRAEIFDWQGGSVGHTGVPNEINRVIIEGDFLRADRWNFHRRSSPVWHRQEARIHRCSRSTYPTSRLRQAMNRSTG
jgi:hypothetical protein